MQQATALSLAATAANLLQGWDNGAIGGALLYLKPELQVNATMEGFIVSSNLVGAWCSTLYSGAGADRYGRRAMLRFAACFFILGACIMIWTPNVYVLLLARVLLGAGIGFITTIVPMYIAEIAPSEIRGRLSTFPQFMGSSGQFFAYVLVFILSLMDVPPWRYMLGMLLVPATVNLLLAVFFIPESPRWLVSKGRMVEAKKVLQRLRNQTDVSAELALLVEGLSVGTETSLEEWQLMPVEDGGASKQQLSSSFKRSSFRLHSFSQASFMQQQLAPSFRDGGVSWIATSTAGDQAMPRRGSSMLEVPPKLSSFIDPVVTLFGSMHSMQQQDQAASAAPYGTFRSTYDIPEPELFEDGKNEQDEEAGYQRGYQSDDNMVGELDEQLTTPLLNRLRSSGRVVDSPRTAGTPRGATAGGAGGGTMYRYGTAAGAVPDYGSRQFLPRGDSSVITRHSSMTGVAPVGSVPDSIASVGIGGGWQLAWQWVGRDGGNDGASGDQQEGQFKRVFLRQQGGEQQQQQGGVSAFSLPGMEPEPVQAAALVGQPAQYSKEIGLEHPVGPAMVHPAETAETGPSWAELMEVGVRRALVVGIGLQILQQFSGINAVQAFIPQILEQSGASVLLTNLGLNSNSASILASTGSSFLVLPCIGLAMKLIDRSGRRQLLLVTLPILLVSLIVIASSDLFVPAGMLKAAFSFLGVVVYVCTFVMGFGAIPNILCSEIFPTRVRGVCIGLCQTAFWTCNIIVTNLFPTLLAAIKVGGIFSVFSAVVLSSWFFVFLKVPETKGMPLEVISEFFAMAGAKQA